MLLTERLKNAATAAFRDNSKLSLMSLEDREAAAQEYVIQAENVNNAQSKLARLYNLERARFLRGEVIRIANSAPKFAQEIGDLDKDN